MTPPTISPVDSLGSIDWLEWNLEEYLISLAFVALFAVFLTCLTGLGPGARPLKKTVTIATALASIGGIAFLVEIAMFVTNRYLVFMIYGFLLGLVVLMITSLKVLCYIHDSENPMYDSIILP